MLTIQRCAGHFSFHYKILTSAIFLSCFVIFSLCAGKDLHWYTRDKKSQEKDMEAAKEEIRKIKEEEEQAMREALGLAPKRATRPQGTRLDKHEFSELVKRGSTAEDLGAGHSEAARVDGLGFSK